MIPASYDLWWLMFLQQCLDLCEGNMFRGYLMLRTCFITCLVLGFMVAAVASNQNHALSDATEP